MTEPSPSQGSVEKLKLLKSPLSNDLAAHNELSTGFQQAIGAEASHHLGYDKELNPTFLRYSEATNLETFYDLFLAACISLFNKNQQVNASSAISNYIGFFSLIWTTWLVTSLYDVRFVTDSIFERCARGIHMGVLVGFVTTSPNFDTSKQDADIFQTFSIILMVSRLCLVLQYGVILWHTRKYKVTFLPLSLMIVVNFVAAIIYLGVSFRFHQNGSSRVFGLWYALGAAEMILTLGLGLYYRVLSFEGTHLIGRVSLLTLIIFGEGVAQACGKITDIVKVGSHAEWTPRTIGVVAAGIIIVYVIFMLYFDWMPTWDLSKGRQVAWTILHYPLHLTMTLLVEGAAQLILYWKCIENGNEWATALGARLAVFQENHGTQPDYLQEMAAFLQNEIEAYTLRWPTTYSNSDFVLTNSVQKVNATTLEDMVSQEDVDRVSGYMYNILVTLQNVLYHKYQVDFIPDIVKAFNTTEMQEKYASSFAEDGGYDFNNDIEYEHQSRVMERFKIVFQYTFICGGAFLAFASILYIVARPPRWTPWAVIRISINFLLALAIGLTALIANGTITRITPQMMIDAGNGETNQSSSLAQTPYVSFVETPGVLPTLLAGYLVVLLANHMTGDGPSFSFFKSFRSRKKSAPSPQQEDVQLVHMPAGTKYDPGAHVMADAHQPHIQPYAQQQPHIEPYTQQAPQYQPYGQQQQQYQPVATQPYTTVYEYSGNDGPRVQQQL